MVIDHVDRKRTLAKRPTAPEASLASHDMATAHARRQESIHPITSAPP